LFAFFFCLGADGDEDEADADEDVEVRTDELCLFTFEKHFELFICFFLYFI
jgi:hypothetical protein